MKSSGRGQAHRVSSGRQLGSWPAEEARAGGRTRTQCFPVVGTQGPLPPLGDDTDSDLSEAFTLTPQSNQAIPPGEL